MLIFYGILLAFSCKIESILTCPEECHCANEESVDCSKRDLKLLPDDLDPQVKAVDLSSNLLTSVPRDLRRVAGGLRWLILAHNRIDALDTELGGLRQLEALDLSWNAFRHARDIRLTALTNLTSLHTVHLSHNHLVTFPECGHPLLGSLHLRNCSINALNPGVLSVFPSLTTLDLSGNNLTLMGGQFVSRSLSIFNLSECGVQQVTHTALSRLKALQSLDLSRNFELKSFRANSTTLEVLDLSDCNLERVPEGFLPNLTLLDLDGNHIRRLEAGMLKSMPRVEILRLGNNAIEFVDPDSFKGGSDLREVDLSRNTFRTLDENLFKEAGFLGRLDLGKTYLDSMVPFKSSSLYELDLTNCEIADLPWDSLLGMRRLESLILSGNLLNTIPVNLTSTTLMRLNLSNNRLTSLKNTTFALVPNLTSLNIHGNRLVQLEFYPSFKNIRSFFLQDNPWTCECKSESFELFYSVLSRITSDVDQARCQSPSSVEGLTWAEACSDEWFPWDFAQADKAWIGSVVIVAVFAATCCLFIFVNKECGRRRKRRLEAEMRNQQAVRERLAMMIEAATNHRETESRNAPDPRESLGPPSYSEAITMPPLGSTASLYSRKDDISVEVGNPGSPSIHGSLAASLNEFTVTSNGHTESRSKPRRKKRGKSPHRMSQASHSSGQISNQLSSQRNRSESSQSNPELLEKSERPLTAKAKRRRKRSQTRLHDLKDSSDSDFQETDM